MKLPTTCNAFALVRCFSNLASLLVLLDLRCIRGKPIQKAFINHHDSLRQRQEHDQVLLPSVVIPVISSSVIPTTTATRTTPPLKRLQHLSRSRILRLFLSDNDEDAKDSASTTRTSSSTLNNNSSRWVGNFKPPIQKLSDIGKAKKHTLRVTIQNETKVLLKKKYESIQHVLVKAVLWKLFYNDYEQLDIEKDIGDANYLPDVVALDLSVIDDHDTSMDDCNSDDTVRKQQQLSPLFWGESGRMTLEKARELCQRYPTTHIVWMRWGIPMAEFAKLAAPALAPVTANRPGRFTLAALPNKNVWELFDYNPINEECHVLIGKDDVEWFEMDDYVKMKSS